MVNMEQILLYATILAPIVAALVQVAKKYVPAEGKEILVIAIGLGALCGAMYGLTVAGTDIVLYTWGGFIAGLASAGVFELFKPKKDDGQMINHSELDEEFTLAKGDE